MRQTVLCLLVLALAACEPAGDRASPEGGIAATGNRVLTLAHVSTLGDTRSLMDRLERDFEESHSEVDVRQVVMDDDDYQKFGLLNLFTSRSSPDVYFQWGGYLVERDARAGFSRDLTPFLERDRFREGFTAGSWIGTDAAGRTHLLPHAIQLTVVLYYNRAIFRKLSLRPPSTWPQFVTLCTTLRGNGITPLVAGNKDLWMVGNWAAHIASRVVGEETYHRTLSLERAYRFDSPGWIRALELLADLVRRRAFNPGVVSMTEDEAKVDFIHGRAAMIADGNWLVSDIIKESQEGIELDHAFFNTPAIPQGRGNQESVIATCSGYAMGSRTGNPELSWKLLREFFRAERQREWVARGYVSSVAAAREAGPPAVEKVMALLEDAPVTVSPPDTGYEAAAWQAFYDAVQQVLAGQRSPHDALAEAERFIAVFRPRR